MVYISNASINKEYNVSMEQESNNDNSKPKKKYDKQTWKKIMDTTQSNYANMIKRITRKSKVSNFTLIYYSIFLIISTLTCKYFSDYYNSVLAEYFSIILSVIILAYSIINNNANYNIRINNIEDSLNEIKNLKRQLDDDNKLENCVQRYNEITDKTERRDDIDFFNTVKQLAKLYNVSIFTKKLKKGYSGDEEKISVVIGYLSEINVTMEIAKATLEYIWYIIIILIPIAVFILCILVKVK